MTPLGSRILATEEALAGASGSWQDLPFGRALVSADWPDLAEANRIVIPDPAMIPPHAGALTSTIESVFARRSIRRLSVWIALGPGLEAPEATLRELAALADEPEDLLLLAGERAKAASAPLPAGFALRPVVAEPDWIAFETVEAELAAETEAPAGRAARLTAWRRATGPRGSCAWFLATMSGAPAGLAGLLHAGDLACVVGLAERPALRRRGVGPALLAALAAWPACAGATTLATILPSGQSASPGPAPGLTHEGSVRCWTIENGPVATDRP